MEPNLLVGQPIPLYMQLYDNDPAKYVRVTLRDADNVELEDSPVDLSPVGDEGLYYNSDVLMPDTTFVTAQFIVYDDAEYSEISANEGADMAMFWKME